MSPDLARIVEAALGGSVPSDVSTSRALRELADEVSRRTTPRPPLTHHDAEELRALMTLDGVSLEQRIALRTVLAWIGVVGERPQFPVSIIRGDNDR